MIVVKKRRGRVADGVHSSMQTGCQVWFPINGAVGIKLADVPMFRPNVKR
jgi:hypothetical protein